MNSRPATWERIPVLVRAILSGFAVLMFGALGWSAVVIAVLKLTAFAPRATGPAILVFGGLFLWAYWRYLGGAGWPLRTAAARRRNLRARALPMRLWAWSLAAGALAILAYVAGIFVWGRVIHLQPWTVAEVNRFPVVTLCCLLIGTAAEAGLVEEAAFRGYMQVPVENRYGPRTAIAVVSILFGCVHLANGYHELTWLFPYVIFGFILGTLAYLTNSIWPGVVLHAVGDAVRFFLNWKLGPNPPQVLIWRSGPDASFRESLVIAVVLGVAAVAVFRKLAATAARER